MCGGTKDCNGHRLAGRTQMQRGALWRVVPQILKMVYTPRGFLHSGCTIQTRSDIILCIYKPYALPQICQKPPHPERLLSGKFQPARLDLVGAAGVEPAHANAPRYPVWPGIRPKHYGEKGDRTFFLIMYSSTTWCVSGLFDFEYLHALFGLCKFFALFRSLRINRR